MVNGSLFTACLERENAAILNAALHTIGQQIVNGFNTALHKLNISAATFFSQNDGTLMNGDYTKHYPIFTIGCGPTNSIRGAYHLSGIKDALVLDVGGTTSDIGALVNSFPRQSAISATVGGVDTNFRTPMTICGLTSGYSGDGAKAVLPREAKAKIDCRMVPGQTGQHLYRCIKRHLRKHGFSDVQVKLIQSQSAFRTDINDPFVDLVKRTAVDAYKSKVILYPNSPGAGPMGLFDDHLHLPIVSTGVGWTKSNSHAPNESIRIQDYKEGMLHMVYLLKSFSGLQA
jgi:acetylornithine deacetylase/succinyl-diaminopimelate desuccinylase-like protein